MWKRVTAALVVSGVLLVALAVLTARNRLATGLDGDVVVVQDGGAAEGLTASVIRELLDTLAADPHPLDAITIPYPFEGAVYPPEMVAPTVLWHDAARAPEAWLVEVAFVDSPYRVLARVDGVRPDPVIDADAVQEGNQFEEDARIAGARGWTPDADTWDIMKAHSVNRNLTLTLYGVARTQETGWRLVSQGRVLFRTSADPVGAPLFYRDVPLMPTRTREGVVQPLAADAIPLIQWRLRDISQPDAPVVLSDMPTCGNCHTFSLDGKRLGMDVDGPDGDKGAYALVDVAPEMSIEKTDVISWNSFRRTNPYSKMSFGLFPRVSPDGRYAAATVHEQVYVQNYMDFRFLQTFYPTRGIIAIYDKQTGRMEALPGADDPDYVQTNPTWSPDGQTVVFIRARARDSYTDGPVSTYANDPNERQIQYDLYRVPFNDGRGGTPEPVIGASHNGMSNSFPAFSPDGRWIVYVQARNGLLMRPDSKLFIIPAEGGEARELASNLWRMNSWHSWSPNSRWLAFASKSFRPFTQIFLTHIDADGNASPPVLLPGSTADNRAINLPEFANIEPGYIRHIATPAVHYRRLLHDGFDLANDGDFGTAIGYYEDSLALKSDYPPTHVAYGYALSRLGRVEEAILHYQKALGIDPYHAEAYCHWAKTLIQHGRPDAAIGHLRTAIDLHPLYDEAYTDWGNALALMDDLEGAVAKYRKALSMNIENAVAHLNLATLLMRTGDMSGALEHYQLAVHHKDDYPAAHFALGSLLLETGRTADAIRHLERAAELRPGDARVRGNLGVACLQTGRDAEGVAHFRAAIEIDPDNDLAAGNLAWIRAAHPDAALRDGREAVALATRLQRRNPTDLHVLVTLAAAQAEVGDFESARATARQAHVLAADSEADRRILEQDIMPRLEAEQPIRIRNP